MSEHDLYARALDLIKEEAAQKAVESAQHIPQHGQPIGSLLTMHIIASTSEERAKGNQGRFSKQRPTNASRPLRKACIGRCTQFCGDHVKGAAG
jgi:hypothetical protein